VAIVAITITKVVKAIVATRQGHGASASELAQLQHHLEQLAAAVEDSQSTQSDQAAQIAELQERLDFAERMLAQARDRAALGAGQKRE
jgi:flagellar biosynthesis chaperone FliJ